MQRVRLAVSILKDSRERFLGRGNKLMKNKLVVQYAGFWRRLAATLIDSLLIALVMLLMLLAIYGAEYFEGGAKIKSG